jgi:hypothetical protein
MLIEDAVSVPEIVQFWTTRNELTVEDFCCGQVAARRVDVCGRITNKKRFGSSFPDLTIPTFL